jgi:uncharacterized protein (TIGR02145 family)
MNKLKRFKWYAAFAIYISIFLYACSNENSLNSSDTPMVSSSSSWSNENGFSSSDAYSSQISSSSSVINGSSSIDISSSSSAINGSSSINISSSQNLSQANISSSSIIGNLSSSSIFVASSSSLNSSSSVTYNYSFSQINSQNCSFNELTNELACDEQTYKTVKIGNQTWMKENLNFETSSGSYCYNDSSKYCNIYGRLYDWITANEVCPIGWKLPSDNDWKVLELLIGIPADELNSMGFRGVNQGNQLKAISNLWRDSDGTDEFGFSALPAGSYSGYYFDWINGSATFHTATIYDEMDDGTIRAYFRDIRYDYNGLYRSAGSAYESVRCIKM